MAQLYYMPTGSSINYWATNVTSPVLHGWGWPMHWFNSTCTTSNLAWYHSAIAAAPQQPLMAPRIPSRVTILHQQQMRRALRRSAELFRLLRPEDELRRFMAGEPIVASGRMFDYELRKDGQVLGKEGHGYLKVCARAKGGRLLAHGCVYIAGTPVLDQVLAFILHAGDDEAECDFLRRANWWPGLSVWCKPERLAVNQPERLAA